MIMIIIIITTFSAAIALKIKVIFSRIHSFGSFVIIIII